jgi:hypothetical protein
MSESALQVGVDGDLIVVTDPATRYYAIYSKPSDHAEMLAHGRTQHLTLLRRRDRRRIAPYSPPPALSLLVGSSSSNQRKERRRGFFFSYGRRQLSRRAVRDLFRPERPV